MKKKKFTVQPGDKVSYSVQFLKSIGQSHSDLARDRGVVISTNRLGKHSYSTTLATINWKGDSPTKVNVQNLAIVGPNMRHCQW